MEQYIWGAHIGQGEKSSSFAVVEVEETTFKVIDIGRLKIKGLYSHIGGDLRQIYLDLKHNEGMRVKEPNLLRVDITGIGEPAAELLRGFKYPVQYVYLTGGYKALKDKDNALLVPKELLISRLKILFLTERLIKLHGLPGGPELIEELNNYETKVHTNEALWNPKVGIGQYDDLAIALGLACWPTK